jgi:hypothetical protein
LTVSDVDQCSAAALMCLRSDSRRASILNVLCVCVCECVCVCVCVCVRVYTYTYIYILYIRADVRSH